MRLLLYTLLTALSSEIIKLALQLSRYGLKYKVLLMPLDGTWQVPHKDTGITNERGRNQHTAPDYGGLHDAQLCV